MARTIGPYGSSIRAGQAAARSTVIGWRRAPMRTIASSSSRLTPTPAVPSISTVRVRPWAASSRTAARSANASSRPTNRALVYLPDMAASYGPRRLGWTRMTDLPRSPHPANTLNELPGEEWLYFTKSLLTTAYPSELGHAARKAHGANKPPRLMARLIEFFSRTGEIVLDPFAGVGGTLLGAAIARGPRRAIGIELEPRWAEVFEGVVRDLSAERDGLGPELAELGTADPGGPRGFDPSGLRAARRRRAGRAADARGRFGRSASRPTRRTTSSCR